MHAKSRQERGATYLFALLAVVILGISATIVVQQWKTQVQREQEADLLAKGLEIQTAIAAYSAAMKLGRTVPGEIYPETLGDLTKPPKPFLRKAYKDPMTGGDWDYVREPETGRIKGVRSKSTATVLKEHDFPPAVHHFEGLTRYNQWVFEYPNPSMTAPPPPAAAPGGQTPSAPAGQNPTPPAAAPPPLAPAPQNLPSPTPR